MSWLPGATLRVSAILLVALLLAWLLRRRAASLRHAVLVIALGCAAIVPLPGALLFPWTAGRLSIPAFIPVLSPALQAPASTPALPGFDSTAAAQHAYPVSAGNAAAPAQAGGAPREAAAPHRLAQRAPAWNTRELPLLREIYFAGLAISLLVLLSGLLRLRSMMAESQPLRAQHWLDELALIRESYGIRRPVQLWQSGHSAVLATCGFLRPHVLLPAGAEHWQTDRVRAVLLHELAHVRRNDWLVQLLAQLFRACHWFNPLAWLVCRRLRAEGEQACDDAALQQGLDCTEYATQLLALARGFAQPAFLPAPSMAHGGALRQRIAGILDPGVARTAASGTSMVKTAAIMLALTWLVAACQLARMPAPRIDLRPHAAARGNVPAPQPDPPAVVESAQSSGQAAVASSPFAEPTAAPEPSSEDLAMAPVIAAQTSGASPRMIAADIADFARSTLSTGVLARPLGNEFLTGRMDMLVRVAQRLLNDDGDAVSVAAKGTALLAALADAGNSAANMAAQRSEPWETRQELQQLAERLQEKSTALAAAILPLPAVTSIVVATPQRRAALEALDLAQTARAEPLLGGARPHRSLLAGLDTLERAAQSVVLGDDGEQPAASARVTALSAALLMTARVAANIGERPVEPPEGRRKAADLAASLRGVATRLGVAAPPADDTQWQGWALPRELSLPEPTGWKP